MRLKDVKITKEHLEEDDYKGGLKYSELIKKNGRFNFIKFFINAIKEKQFLPLFRIIRRTFRIGWSIPFHNFLKKRKKFWKKFSYNTMNKWGIAFTKICKANIKVYLNYEFKENKTYFFVSNHQSPADIPVLSATIPVNNSYVANKEFDAFFVTKYWVKNTGGVLVDKKNGLIKAFRDIKNSLDEGHNLIIFPESVMSKDGKLQEFKRGGLQAATLSNVSIVPIYLKGTRNIIAPGNFSVKFNKDVFVFFGQPIDATNLTRYEKKNISQIVYEKMKDIEDNLENPSFDRDFETVIS